MPIMGYKKKFKNIKSLSDDIFTINFKLKYNGHGFLNICDVDDNYFDVGDFRILLDKVFDDFNENKLREYDNGVYILSICKYIVDMVPNLYSINYESKGMIDTYYKEEIIDSYNDICKTEWMLMNNKLYKQIFKYRPYDDKEFDDKEIILEFIKNNDNVLVRDNKIAHMTVSAWITNKDRNKILMIYHNIYDSWAWIGGHADGDDDLLYVVRKEIEEETGITNVKLLSDEIYGLNIITVDNHIKRGKYVNSHLHFDIGFLFEADENDNIRIKEDENSGVKWVDIDKVCEYSTEEKMKPIYKKLIEKMKNI